MGIFFFYQKYVRPELITSVSNYFTVHLHLDRCKSVLLMDSSGQKLPHTDAHFFSPNLSLLSLWSFFLSSSISLLLLSAYWLAQFLVFCFSWCPSVHSCFVPSSFKQFLSLSIPSQPSPIWDHCTPVWASAGPLPVHTFVSAFWVLSEAH